MAARVCSMILAVAFVGAACSATPDPVIFDADDLVTELEAEGIVASVEPWPYGTAADGVTPLPQLLCLDDREATLYEYATTEDRVAEAGDGPPTPEDGSGAGAVGWWARSVVLVAYAHDPDVPDLYADTLTATLGPTLGTTGVPGTGEPPAVPICPSP